MFSLAAQWREIAWNGLLPISLMAFVGWAGISFFWTAYHWLTLGGLAYLVAFTVLGIYVALARDTIQIVRTFGDVLRFVLGLSLSVEIFSGLLIDRPIHFLGVTGQIASLGPIQGLLDTRDQLGLVSVIALITFGTELRTKSISRGVGIGSLIVGGVTLLLTQAPPRVRGDAGRRGGGGRPLRFATGTRGVTAILATRGAHPGGGGRDRGVALPQSHRRRRSTRAATSPIGCPSGMPSGG